MKKTNSTNDILASIEHTIFELKKIADETSKIYDDNVKIIENSQAFMNEKAKEKNAKD